MRKVKLLAPLALISAAVLPAPGGFASADGSSIGSKVHFYEADTALDGSLGKVILTGAITDSGIDHQGVAGGGNYNKLVLSKGTFEISVARFGNQLNFPVNPATCSSAGSATAPIAIVRGTGTGAYKGITGTIKTTVTFASIVPRLADGECNTNATKYPGIGIARGTGAVSGN